MARLSRAVLFLACSALVPHTDPVPTARDRARAELTREITDLARAQLATVGATGLSLRAVARELGMVSSAVYRYFPSRDELLTRLIIDGYEAIGAAAEAADDPVAPPAERWLAVCRAVRRWARDHPHEYALLYGSPVPGYSAPRDTVPAAVRVGAVLGGILGDAARAGLLPGSASAEGTGLVAEDAVPLLGGEHPALDDVVRARALLAWSSVFGAVSFEVFGHYTGAVTDADRFFDAAMADLAGLLGLRPADAADRAASPGHLSG
jgi:AcrR family transcriptional regulator